jgi:hypothetical protein
MGLPFAPATTVFAVGRVDPTYSEFDVHLEL